MNRRIKVTRNYQVTIPADIRKRLGIEEGDYLEVKVRGEEIILRKARIERRRIKLGKRIDTEFIEEMIEEGLKDAISY